MAYAEAALTFCALRSVRRLLSKVEAKEGRGGEVGEKRKTVRRRVTISIKLGEMHVWEIHLIEMLLFRNVVKHYVTSDMINLRQTELRVFGKI